MPALLSWVHLSRLNARRGITCFALLAGAAGFAQSAGAQIQAERRAAAPPLHATLNIPDGPLFHAIPSFRSGEPALFAGALAHPSAEVSVVRPVSPLWLDTAPAENFKPVGHRPRGARRAANWILQEALGDDGIRQIKQGCDMARRFGARTQQY